MFTINWHTHLLIKPVTIKIANIKYIYNIIYVFVVFFTILWLFVVAKHTYLIFTYFYF